MKRLFIRLLLVVAAAGSLALLAGAVMMVFRLGQPPESAIDPSRVETPVAERAYSSESVLFGHTALLAEPAAMRAIVDACAKLHEQRDELAAWALAEQVSDPARSDPHRGARTA